MRIIIILIFCLVINLIFSQTKIKIEDSSGKINDKTVIKLFDENGNEIKIPDIEVEIEKPKSNQANNIDSEFKEKLKNEGWDIDRNTMNDSLMLGFNENDLKKWGESIEKRFNNSNMNDIFNNMFNQFFENDDFFNNSAQNKIKHSFKNPLIIINNRYFDKSELKKLKSSEIKDFKIIKKDEAIKKYKEKMESKDGAIEIQLK